MILIIGILTAFSAMARETVTGTVVDSHGDPIPGVKVEIPGSSEYVFTDLDGRFQLILREPTKKLNFTYPGLGTTSHRVAPEMRVLLGKGWAGREKGYRSMFDIEGGLGFKGNVTFQDGDNQVRNIHTFLLTGFTTTHGCQITRNLFVGAGVGVYLECLQYEEIEDYYHYYDSGYDCWKNFDFTGAIIPLYVAARWDFGLSQKTAPYIGLRIGYSAFVSFDSYEFAYVSNGNDLYRKRLEVNQKSHGSFFIAPSIGYRMTVYNKFGINLGLSYMIGRKHKYSVYQACYDYADETYLYDYTQDFTQRASDVILFNIGFDF